MDRSRVHRLSFAAALAVVAACVTSPDSLTGGGHGGGSVTGLGGRAGGSLGGSSGAVGTAGVGGTECIGSEVPATPSPSKLIVLATDGAPACMAGSGDPTADDSTATLDAIADAASRGYPTMSSASRPGADRRTPS